MSDMLFKKAEREQLKAKVAMIGPSGSGKTVSALKLAYGLTGDWEKIAFCDTEHSRAKVYVGTNHTGIQIGQFLHADLEPPYHWKKFYDAVEMAEQVLENDGVLIIDSISHAWDGVGGILDLANEKGGRFQDWREPKAYHKKLVDRIMHSPLHIIVTLRAKQGYAMSTTETGKNIVEKLGLKPVQADDLEYEFLLVFNIEHQTNRARASKDNTGLFKEMYERIEPEHGQKLNEWLVQGKPVKSVIEERREQEAKRRELIQSIQERAKEDKQLQKAVAQAEVTAGPIHNWSVALLERCASKYLIPKDDKKKAETA